MLMLGDFSFQPSSFAFQPSGALYVLKDLMESTLFLIHFRTCNVKITLEQSFLVHQIRFIFTGNEDAGL